MKFINYRLLLVALLLTGMPLVESVAGDANMTGRLGMSALDFDYEETDAGSVLNREDGWLPGVEAGVLYERGAWFVDTRVAWSAGEVDYRAPAQASTTDEEILDLDFMVGRRVAGGDQTDVSLFGGLGYRDWQRDIRSIPGGASGLNENYTWWYASLGIRLDYSIDSHSAVRADIQVRQPLSPEIEVDFLGVFDPVGTDLGEEPGVRLSLVYERNLNDTTGVWVSPWFEYWQLGRSADTPLFVGGVPAGTFFEPRSTTRNFGISAGLTWRFGG